MPEETCVTLPSRTGVGQSFVLNILRRIPHEAFCFTSPRIVRCRTYAQRSCPRKSPGGRLPSAEEIWTRRCPWRKRILGLHHVRCFHSSSLHLAQHRSESCGC